MLIGHAKKIQSALNAECCLEDGSPRYEWKQKLGDGSFGIAYVFSDNQMKRLVTVKASKHPKSLGSTKKVFDRETEISSLVSHPNIVTIYDSLVCGNYAVLIREFLPETLNGFINDVAEEAENPTVERVLQFLEPVCDVIQAAHQKNIINRDIKGQNILIDRSGNKVIVKVADWGSAGKTTSGSSAMSTLFFRAPETLDDNKDKRVKEPFKIDVYSLAAVTIGMFTGNPEPFDTIKQKSDKKYLDGLVAPLKSLVPENAWKALRGCVDPNPGKRCKSIDEFISRLKGQGAVEINTKPAPPKSKAPPKQPSLDSGFMERYQSYEQYVSSARQDSVAGTYSKNTINTVLSKLDGLQKYSAKHSLEKSPEYRSLLEKANAFALRMSEEDIEGRIRVFCDIVNIDRGPLTKKERTELKNKGLSCSADIAQALDDSLKAWQPFRGPTDPNHKIYNP